MISRWVYKQYERENKQAEKLKSREMKEGWMKNDEGWWRMVKGGEGWMKSDDFKLLGGFALGQTDEQTFVIVESLLRLKVTES